MYSGSMLESLPGHAFVHVLHMLLVHIPNCLSVTLLPYCLLLSLSCGLPVHVLTYKRAGIRLECI